MTGVTKGGIDNIRVSKWEGEEGLSKERGIKEKKGAQEKWDHRILAVSREKWGDYKWRRNGGRAGQVMGERRDK